MRNLCIRPNRLETNFDHVLNDFFAAPFFGVEQSGRRAPRVNVQEDDHNIKLTFEIPGLEKSEIKVLVKDNVLSVTAERKVETEHNENGFTRKEFSVGQFSRSFTLPDTVNVEKVSADYKDGLLVVELPKLEEAKPKQIEVKLK